MSDTSEHTTNTEALSIDAGFRPLTRPERRTLWLKEYGEQDFALQALVRLVEQRVLEISVMFQAHGLIIFGVLVSTETYAQFHIDQFEEMFTLAKKSNRFGSKELSLFWEELSDLIENSIPEKLKDEFMKFIMNDTIISIQSNFLAI